MKKPKSFGCKSILTIILFPIISFGTMFIIAKADPYYATKYIFFILFIIVGMGITSFKIITIYDNSIKSRSVLNPFFKNITISFDKIDKICIRNERNHTTIEIYAGEIKTNDWAFLTLWEYKSFIRTIRECYVKTDIFPDDFRLESVFRSTLN